VRGPDIVWADILATAIFASGEPNPEFLKRFSGYSTLVI
jgi:thiamine biosynthesis lipoprotein ApbE